MQEDSSTASLLRIVGRLERLAREVRWKILEAWKWYQRAIWHGEQGNVEELVQSLLIAKDYEEEYHYSIEEEQLNMEKQYYRLRGAEQAKRRKKERRERLAESLIVSGRADTLWKAAYLIERDKKEKC